METAHGGLTTVVCQRLELETILRGQLGGLEGSEDFADPVNWFKGALGLGDYVMANGVSWDTAGHVGSGFLEGINVFDKDDPHEFGESMMNFELTVAPLLAKVPNPTSPKIRGPYGKAITNFTLINLDDYRLPTRNKSKFRIDVGRIPDSPSVTPRARGKVLPHFHFKNEFGKGGRLHRPWETK